MDCLPLNGIIVNSMNCDKFWSIPYLMCYNFRDGVIIWCFISIVLLFFSLILILVIYILHLLIKYYLANAIASTIKECSLKKGK